MRISADHILARTRMVKVLLDGVDMVIKRQRARYRKVA